MLLANLMPLVTTTSRCCRCRRRGTLRSGCGGTVLLLLDIWFHTLHGTCYPFTDRLGTESRIQHFPMLMFTQSKTTSRRKRAVRPKWAAEEYVTTAAFAMNTVVAAVCLFLWIWDFCCRPFSSWLCHPLVWYSGEILTIELLFVHYSAFWAHYIVYMK